MAKSDRKQLVNYNDWDMVLSVSQLETYDLCHRKWWFKSVTFLKEPPRDSQTRGDIFHAVVERYLTSDEQGRDPLTGKPVEPFPEGWDKGLAPGEPEMLRRLFDEGIGQGMIERRPGRMPEEGFVRRVLSAGTDVGDVAIMGLMDLYIPYSPGMETVGEVQDVKTTKDRRWVKSAEKLRTDPQMLLYSFEAFVRADEKGWLQGDGATDKVHVRHNAFVMDPKKPRAIKVDNDITGAEAFGFWNGVVTPRAREMLMLKRAYPQDADRWRNVPGPENEAKACGAYGGCPFLAICAGHESPSRYAARVANLANGVMLSAPSESSPSGVSSMGLLDRLRGSAPAATAPAAAAPAAAAPAAPALAPAAPAPAPAPAPAAAAASAAPDFAPPARGMRAPWAYANCTVCKGTGVKPKEPAPCFVCKTRYKTDHGKHTIEEDFDFTVEGDTMLFAPKGGAFEPENFVVVAVAAAPKAEKREPAPAPVVTTAPAGPAATEETIAADTAQRQVTLPPALAAAPEAAPSASAPRGRGRPSRGMTLLFDVSADRTPDGSRVLLTQHILEVLAPELEKTAGRPFFAMPRYERQDMMAARADAIAAQLGSADVQVSSGDPDALALANALLPYATRIFRALK